MLSAVYFFLSSLGYEGRRLTSVTRDALARRVLGILSSVYWRILCRDDAPGRQQIAGR